MYSKTNNKYSRARRPRAKAKINFVLIYTLPKATGFPKELADTFMATVLKCPAELAGRGLSIHKAADAEAWDSSLWQLSLYTWLLIWPGSWSSVKKHSLPHRYLSELSKCVLDHVSRLNSKDSWMENFKDILFREWYCFIRCYLTSRNLSWFHEIKSPNGCFFLFFFEFFFYISLVLKIVPDGDRKLENR